MTSKIEIPFDAIQKPDPAILDLNRPARCSRCNSVPVPFFETHPVQVQGGFVRSHTVYKKFNTDLKLHIRLPVCDQCHQHDFIEAPETILYGSDALRSAARWRSVGFIASSLIACASFILLMKIIPFPAAQPWLGALWLYLAGFSVLVLLVTNFLVLREIRRVKAKLVKSGYDMKLHRAVVTAKMQYERPAAEDTAVTIEMTNNDWANECAATFGWRCNNLESHPEKEK